MITITDKRVAGHGPEGTELYVEYDGPKTLLLIGLLIPILSADDWGWIKAFKLKRIGNLVVWTGIPKRGDQYATGPLSPEGQEQILQCWRIVSHPMAKVQFNIDF